MRKWSSKASQLVIYKIGRPSHRAPCMQNHAEIKNRHNREEKYDWEQASQFFCKRKCYTILVEVYDDYFFKKTIYYEKFIICCTGGLVQSSSKIF